jgi:hypothetical protein
VFEATCNTAVGYNGANAPSYLTQVCRGDTRGAEHRSR